MNIVAVKPSHDGVLAVLRDSKVLYCLEAEKDSHYRFSPLLVEHLLSALSSLKDTPDVLAFSGWSNSPGGYWGLDAGRFETKMLLGRDVTVFSSSHERAHLLCSYGLSPYAAGRSCYALVWEGIIGCFYEIQGPLRIKRIGYPLSAPGYRFALLYALCDPRHGAVFGGDLDYAGKLMALSAFDSPHLGDPAIEAAVDVLMALPVVEHEAAERNMPIVRRDVPFQYINVGVESDECKALARTLSDRIFSRYLQFAQASCSAGLPLVIGGGCGLNVIWNRRWRDSGVFSDVFVPPCPNDSGAAIGTAIDAQWSLTGSAQVEWTVKCGDEFVWDDCATGPELREVAYDDGLVASALRDGAVLAWVEGRTEIGPRALGGRSLLAGAHLAVNHERLNRIKKREFYRPLAPVCLEGRARQLFDLDGPSPHMLYATRVLKTLPAVTHVDGSARLQTVVEGESALAELLLAVERVTGSAVLINTSLNWKGSGFINRWSELKRFVVTNRIDYVFACGRLFVNVQVVAERGIV